MTRRAMTGPGDPRHGTTNGYNNLKCRCARCTSAWRDRMRDYRARYPEQVEKNKERTRVLRAEKRGGAHDDDR